VFARGSLALALSALVLSCLAGCGSADQDAKAKPDNAPVNASGQNSDQTTRKTKSATLSKVKFKDGNSKTVYSIKFRADGAKLVDDEERELARYNYSKGKVKIKDADDNVLGYIVGDAKKLKVEDASQEITFFKMQSQDDGDWKLEDRQDKLVYRIKKRDYGYELETPDKKRFRKVKSDQGKISLRDPNEKTIYSTKDDIKPLAVACLGCEMVQDIRIRFGMLVAMQRVTADW